MKAEVAPKNDRSAVAPTRRPAAPDVAPGELPPSVLALHRTAGNRAVASVLQGPVPGRADADALEQEADRVADDVVGVPPSAPPATNRVGPPEPGVDHLVPDDVGLLGVSGSAGEETSASGHLLPADVRAGFESRLGVDLGDVRVHADAASGRRAEALGADAFTSGSDIFFGHGNYRPQTPSGRSLLAHELVHTLQQRGGAAAAPAVQRRPKTSRPATETIEFSVDVPASVKTIDEVFRLYERVAYGRVTNSRWTCGDGTCDLSARRGRRVRFQVERRTVEAESGPDDAERKAQAKAELAELEPGERSAVTAEVNRRYAKLTGAERGEKITKGEEGNARTWDNELAGVMADAAKLAQLPPAVRKLMIRDDGKVLLPKDYEQFLRIADKLGKLTAEDLAAFALLPVRATDDLALFEKSVDLFVTRRAELVKAQAAQQAARQQAPAGKDDTLQGALDEQWKDLDEGFLATMSEDDRYDLARRKTAELTAAQLTYMKDHPGETLKDFAKSAVLLNTGETFSAIGKDLSEAANGDANSWARWAAGTGAGAKLSGWLLAVAGVLYVASWLTGIGELVTIGAAAAALLGTTVVLSAAESDLRVKAASQTRDPAEFKRHIEAAAAARANVFVSVAGVIIAVTLHLVAKAAFPKTMQKMSASLARLREKIRLTGSVRAMRQSVTAEMGAHRAELNSACDAAKAEAGSVAKEVAGLDRDGFIRRMESGNGDFLDQTRAPKEQRVDYRELAKSPEGRAAIDEYQRQVVDGLTREVPAEVDALRARYAAAIEKFLAEVDVASTREELSAAVDAFEPQLAEGPLKDFVKARQEAVTAQKVAQSQVAVEREAARLRQAAPAPASAPSSTAIPKRSTTAPVRRTAPVRAPASKPYAEPSAASDVGPATSTVPEPPAGPVTSTVEPTSGPVTSTVEPTGPVTSTVDPAKSTATEPKGADAPAPATRAAGKLPPGVRSTRLRRRGLELIDRLPAAERQAILERLWAMPPEQSGLLLSRAGRLEGAEGLAAALEERRAPVPDPEEPGPARSGLDDSAQHHVDEGDDLTVVENRPNPRVRSTDAQPGAGRGALKARMSRAGMEPPWARAPGDWNPHHMIPVSLEAHPVLDTLRANGGWDNNAPHNGYALPTRPGIPGAEGLPVHQVTAEVVRGTGRPAQPGVVRDLAGHPIWNEHVRARLNALEPLMSDPAALRVQVEALLDDLRAEITASVAAGKPVLF